VAGVIISWHSWRKQSLHVLNTLATIASEEQTALEEVVQEISPMSNLESKLIQDVTSGQTVSLERGLLIASGLSTELEIDKYVFKLEQIHQGFVEKLKMQSPLALSETRKFLTIFQAKLLFEHLWNTKPRRCNDKFLLTEVIDAQLNPDIDCKVGSCVGLTSLYTVIGLRENLNLTVMVSDNHLINRLTVDDIATNIDNTDPLGFDCDIEEKEFTECPPVNLLANVLNSRGMLHERLGSFDRAEKDYGKAIAINPEYSKAYNNRGNMKSKRIDYAGAISDYNRAIELRGRFVEAYCNRGMAKENLGDYLGSIKDFDKAVELNPAYSDGYFRRALVRQRLGDYAGALMDFDQVIELDPESRDTVARFKVRRTPVQKSR
jgi:tetratricopeptide (TPR) repeat protein